MSGIDIPKDDYTYIQKIAYKLFIKSNSYVTLEDLVQVGVVAYLEKRITYDSSINDTMMKYAYLRINGAMKDYIAKNSPKGNATVRPNSHTAKNTYEIYNFTTMEINEDQLINYNYLSPEEYSIRQQALDILEGYYNKLTDLEKQLLIGFFIKQKSKVSLATEYKISRHRVHNIIHNCLLYLKKFVS